jgi:prophage regulatory protein
MLEKEVRYLTGLSRATRWRLEQKSHFPKRVLLSPGRVGWYENEILEWIETRQPVCEAV